MACCHGHGNKPSTPKMERMFFLSTLGLLRSQRLSPWFQASAAKQVRSALFCVTSQRMVIIPYRAFFLYFLTLEDRIDRSSRNVSKESVIYRKSAELMTTSCKTITKLKFENSTWDCTSSLRCSLGCDAGKCGTNLVVSEKPVASIPWIWKDEVPPQCQ